MNDQLLIIILKAILDIGDGKRKCREWLGQLEAKQATVANATATAAPTQGVKK